jgi:putative nucleotidyltransferase with HDIG domain
MPKIDLDVVFRVTQKLPGLPQTTLRALQVINNPDFRMAELTNIIRLDQALAARVLQWANSPFYGLRHKVSTLEHAIMVMGANAIQGLLLTIAVREKLVARVSGYGLKEGELWRHSVAVAGGARWLAVKQKYKQPDQAFVAGLLHDIGKLVLDELLRYESSWEQEWSKLREQGASFIELEHWLTGLDHAELGSKIAQQWNLPELLIESIAYHHAPEKATIEPCLTNFVHLADAAALMIGTGLGYDGLSYELNEKTLTACHIDVLDLEELMQAEVEYLEDAEFTLDSN